MTAQKRKMYTVDGAKVFENPKKVSETVSYIVAISFSDELIDKMEKRGYKLLDASYSDNGMNKILDFKKDNNVYEWV